MSWATSELLGQLLDVVSTHLRGDELTNCTLCMIEMFEMHGCDTVDELTEEFPLVREYLYSWEEI